MTNSNLFLFGLLNLGLSAILLFFNLSARLALLQQKDYLRQRLLADRYNVRQNQVEFISAFCFLLVVFWIIFAGGQGDFGSRLSSYLVVLVTVLIVQSLALVSVLLKVLKRRWPRPKITLRVILTAFTFALSIPLFILLLNDSGLAFLVVNSFTIWILILANELVRRVVNIGHRRQMSKASERLAKLTKDNGLVTIGITGSYGKSTTKMFLNTILKEAFGENSVISTPGSINTDVGLAQSINSQLDKKTPEEIAQLKFAVLEMDTYMIGTLARITRYFPLDIALLTSLNEQHLETFGGKIENTMQGNYEIFAGLRPEGMRVGVFGVDNDLVAKLLKRFKQDSPESKTLTYGVSEGGSEGVSGDESDTKRDVYAQDIKEVHEPGSAKLTFKLTIHNSTPLHIELPVPGEFNAANYTAAASIAHLLSAPAEKITAAASKVSLKQRTLAIALTNKGNELVDDSFSSNPASVRADLEFINRRQRSLPMPTLVVFAGVIDLNQESARIHEEIGDYIAESNLITVVTNYELGQSVQKGAGDKANLVSYANNTDSLKDVIEGFAAIQKNPFRVLIIGRIPVVLAKFIKKLI